MLGKRNIKLAATGGTAEVYEADVDARWRRHADRFILDARDVVGFTVHTVHNASYDGSVDLEYRRGPGDAWADYVANLGNDATTTHLTTADIFYDTTEDTPLPVYQMSFLCDSAGTVGSIDIEVILQTT